MTIQIYRTLLIIAIALALNTPRAYAQVSDRSPYTYGILSLHRGEFTAVGTTHCADVTIRNRGNGLLTIDSIWWQGNRYGISSQLSLPLQLEAEDSVIVQVCRSGAAQDLPQDILHVKSNDRNSIAWGIAIDKSKTMDSVCPDIARTRLDVVKSASRELVDSAFIDLPADDVHDLFEVLAYSGNQRPPNALLFPLTPLVRVTLQAQARANSAIDTLTAFGKTYTGDAIEEVSKNLQATIYKIYFRRYILLFTDGKPSEDDMLLWSFDRLTTQLRERGSSVYPITLHSPSSISLFDSLASFTGGLHRHASDCEELMLKAREIIRHINQIERTTSAIDFPGHLTLDVGTDAQATALSMTLAPNPAITHVDIDIRCGENRDISIAVLDLQGRVVISGTSTSSSRSTDNLFRLRTDGIAPGMYMVVVRDGSGRTTSGRFIVVR